MKELKFKVTGETPLLINGPGSIDPIGKWAKQLSKITSKRKKTEEDHLEISKLQWHASLDGYFDKDVGLFMPSPSIYASIQSAAKMNRQGAAVDRGMSVDFIDKAKIYFPHHTKSLSYLYDNGDYVDRRAVGVNGSKVMATRAIFKEWEFSSKVLFDEKIFDDDTMKELITNAGRYIGIGTYRRFFGRFSVEFL